MPRYDKYNPVSGGFRAAAKVAANPANYGVVLGAGLDANGLMEHGAASNSGFVGVCIVDRTKRRAGDIQDIMTSGEIVDCTGLTAGTAYYLNATTGVLQTTETRYRVGQTVEAWRLVVRWQDQGAT